MNILNFFSSKKCFWATYVFVVLGWIIFAICDYLFLGFRTWDTAAHVQPILHWVLYGEYIDKLLGVGHPFVNHFRPGLLVLAPFFYLFHSVLIIHLAKIIAFASCPLIFLYFGKKQGLNKTLYVLPTLWLIHDVLITTMYSENQATSIALPFVIWAFCCAINKNYKIMLIPLALMLLFKENLSLVWLCIGSFIAVEHKNWKLGLSIFAGGLVTGLSTYFYIIPLFSEGTMQHSADSFEPTLFIGKKIVMLIRAYLSMGFFIWFRPKALLYTLPAYGIFLVGGHKVHQAFFLANHTHDFTTAILMGAFFYVVIKTSKNESKFDFNIKSHRIYLKTVAVILLGFWIAKLPLLKLIPAAKTFNTAREIKATASHINQIIDKSTYIYAGTRVMDIFLENQHIRPFDFGHFNMIKMLNNKNPHYIIFPTEKPFSKLNPKFVKEYLDLLNKHQQLGLCNISIYNHSKRSQVAFVFYEKPLSDRLQNEAKLLMKKYM